MDWSITTLLMLIALCNILSFNTKINIDVKTIAIIVLNYCMLYRYTGEFIKNKFIWLIIGFIPFILIYYIYITFIKNKYSKINYI